MLKRTISDKKAKKNLLDSLTIDNAKSVLNNLIQQKKISTPILEIKEINKDKRKLWECKATLQKENLTFTAICPRKNRAMQESIFALLQKFRGDKIGNLVIKGFGMMKFIETKFEIKNGNL